MSDKPSTGDEKTVFDPDLAKRRQAADSAFEKTQVDPNRRLPDPDSEKTVLDTSLAHPSQAANSGAPSAPAIEQALAQAARAANEPRRAISAKPAAASTTLPVGFRLFEY